MFILLIIASRAKQYFLGEIASDKVFAMTFLCILSRGTFFLEISISTQLFCKTLLWSPISQ